MRPRHATTQPYPDACAEVQLILHDKDLLMLPRPRQPRAELVAEVWIKFALPLPPWTQPGSWAPLAEVGEGTGVYHHGGGS